VRELHALVRELVQTKRARPGNDLFSRLVRGRDEGELTETELVAMAQLLLVAGQEGPANSIATGIFLLLRQPDVRAELQRNPALLPGGPCPGTRRRYETLDEVSKPHRGYPEAGV
jgi:cytochrome P450